MSPQPFEIAVGDFRIGVIVGEKSAVTGIWADLSVPRYRDWMPSLTPGDGNARNPHRVDFKEPPESERLVELLQYVESLGSFWLGIHRIDWRTAKREWIVESPEEKEHLPVFSISSSLSYERRRLPFTASLLSQIVAAEAAKSWLVIPMSFLREGQNDYEAHRYINAFYNFYFFIEDFFGNGQDEEQADPRGFSIIKETARRCSARLRRVRYTKARVPNAPHVACRRRCKRGRLARLSRRDEG